MPRLFLNAHHRGFWPQQLEVVWSLLLQAGSEGPTLIFCAVARTLWKMRSWRTILRIYKFGIELWYHTFLHQNWRFFRLVLSCQNHNFTTFPDTFCISQGYQEYKSSINSNFFILFNCAFIRNCPSTFIGFTVRLLWGLAVHFSIPPAVSSYRHKALLLKH